MNEDQKNQQSPPNPAPPQFSAPPNPSQALPPSPNPAPQPAIQNPNSPYPNLPPGQFPIGVSASQMGFNQPKNRLLDFSPKELVIKGVVGLIILILVFFALVFTNILAITEFKNIGYTTTNDTRYKLDFYSRHSTKKTPSDSTQLISKVSKGGKFPLSLVIESGDNKNYSYTKLKDCSSFRKVFDVPNDNIRQNISVCDPLYGKQIDGQNASDAVYVAGFIHNDNVTIITIGQDYGDINLSSQKTAKESLEKFGMAPYKEDIAKIISSIKVE